MQKLNWRFYLNIFFQMLRSDITVFKNEVVDKIINSLIYAFSFIVISSYLLPSFGIDPKYGLLMASGLVAGVGIFELFMAVIAFTSDLTGDKTINFYLTLPMPSWLIFARMVCYSALTGGVLSLFIIPLSKLLLWNQMDLLGVSWLKFGLIFMVMNLFYGTCALFMSSCLEHMGQISNVWMRIIFPLYIFGGFQFTWYSFYKVAPTFAYLDLLNPFLYGVEGTRAAILGQDGFLPYWVCVGALSILTVGCFLLSIKRLQKKLDYV